MTRRTWPRTGAASLHIWDQHRFGTLDLNLGPDLHPGVSDIKVDGADIRAGEYEPEIHETAFVHPDAVVIGRVRIGPEASVWPCAVLRGDHGRIEVGARTSVQDGTVVHCTHEWPTDRSRVRDRA